MTLCSNYFHLWLDSQVYIPSEGMMENATGPKKPPSGIVKGMTPNLHETQDRYRDKHRRRMEGTLRGSNSGSANDMTIHP